MANIEYDGYNYTSTKSTVTLKSDCYEYNIGDYVKNESKAYQFLSSVYESGAGQYILGSSCLKIDSVENASFSIYCLVGGEVIAEKLFDATGHPYYVLGNPLAVVSLASNIQITGDDTTGYSY